MTIKAKAVKVLTWALGAVLVSAGVAWAATLWRVDSYGNIKAARSTVLLSAGQASNCKLDYTGSTLSVLGADGNALSASNPCIVGMPNGAEPLVFTAPFSTTFGAASDTDGNLFGILDINWSEPMPMYLYACDGSTGPYFGFARQRTRKHTGSAATAFCQKGDTDCDAQEDMFLMSSGLTLGNEVSKVCVSVGSFRATFTAADDSWAVTALNSGQDGFNLFQNGIWFDMAPGQNGNESGKYLNAADGATSLAFNTQVAKYQLLDNDFVAYHVNLTSRSANGGDATTVRLYLPFQSRSGTDGVAYYTGGGRIHANATHYSVSPEIATAQSTYMTLMRNDNGNMVSDVAFAQAGDYIGIGVVFPAAF